MEYSEWISQRASSRASVLVRSVTGQVHDTSGEDQEDLRTNVLAGDGVEAINPNTAIEDHDGS